MQILHHGRAQNRRGGPAFAGVYTIPLALIWEQEVDYEHHGQQVRSACKIEQTGEGNFQNFGNSTKLPNFVN